MASWKGSLIEAISTFVHTWKASWRRTRRVNWKSKKLADGTPKHRGSGKDLSYFDDQTRERFIPHVIEPSAGADRGTLAFICEAYHEDQQPDEKGEMQERVVMKFHPRLAPVKAAVFPLIKKEGMPEKAAEIYGELKAAGLSVQYDQQAAIGRRYRRQDEIGTPFCITVDGDTAKDNCVTVRDRDTLQQDRVPVSRERRRLSLSRGFFVVCCDF
jgi:glycyl-tRNA synthetase